MSFSVGSDPIADLAEVAELYDRHAVRVRRLVRLDVAGPEALVEDACQTAWMRLVRHHERVARGGAIRWLVKVARHEAWRVITREAREQPLDELELNPGTRRSLATPDLVDDLVVRRGQVEAIRALSERQRQLVWLQGLGFSYAEIAGRTGDSRRTVERQLLRAHRALHDERRAA